MRRDKRLIYNYIFLSTIAILILLFSACGPVASDLIPTNDLPDGIIFDERTDTAECDSLPGKIGDNVVSFSQAVYDCDQPGDAYVLVMECKDEEAVLEMFNELNNEVLNSSIYSKKSTLINESEVVEAYTSSPSEYVFLWQKDSFVVLVMGSSREDAFSLASIVEQR